MNKQNIQELINRLETIDEDDFDLDDYTHPCGAPACVAGHATTLDSWKLRGGMKFYTPSYMSNLGAYAFALWAGISKSDAWVICGLVHSNEIDEFYGTSESGRVSASMAAAALRRYLTTGLKVDE